MTQPDSAALRPVTLQASGGFWAIFAMSFAVFLVIACCGQLLGVSWRSWLPGAEGVKSIFGGVNAGVYTFMSHLL